MSKTRPRQQQGCETIRLGLESPIGMEGNLGQIIWGNLYGSGDHPLVAHGLFRRGVLGLEKYLGSA
jgi:hypothetical protein